MLGRKTLLSVISFILTYFIQSVILILAINQFLSVQFGYTKVAQSIFAFFLFFSDLCLSTVHLKLMAEEKRKNILFSTYFLIKIILLLISSITFIFIILFLLNFNLITNNTQQILIISVIFLDRIFMSFLKVYTISFQAKLKIAKKELATIFGKLFGMVFALVSIFIFNNFILYLANTIISNIISLLLSIYYGKEFKLTKVRRKLLIKYFKLNLVLIIPYFLNIIIINLGPLIFLQYYNEELLGVFNVIISFYSVIKGLEQVLRSLFIPNFSSELNKNNLKTIKNTIHLFENYSTILNGVIIIFGIIFGDFIMKLLFGYFYFKKGLFLYWGCIISLLSYSILGAYSPLVIAAENYKIYTLNRFISLFFSILSWLFLIPLINILGIKLGTWISTIFQAIFIRYYCNKRYKIGKMRFKFTLNLLFVLFLISISIYIYFLNLTISLRILVAILILCIYLFFLILTKTLTIKDYRYLISVINPKKMVKYIKENS